MPAIPRLTSPVAQSMNILAVATPVATGASKIITSTNITADASPESITNIERNISGWLSAGSVIKLIGIASAKNFGFVADELARMTSLSQSSAK